MIRSAQSNKDPFPLPSLGFCFLFLSGAEGFCFLFSHSLLLHFSFFHLLIPALLRVHAVTAVVGITESLDTVLASFWNSELEDAIFGSPGWKASGIGTSYPMSEGGGCSVAVIGNLKKKQLDGRCNLGISHWEKRADELIASSSDSWGMWIYNVWRDLGVRKCLLGLMVQMHGGFEESIWKEDGLGSSLGGSSA